MAAPTALAVSKLFYPETEESKTTIKLVYSQMINNNFNLTKKVAKTIISRDLKVENEDDANVLDAAAKVNIDFQVLSSSLNV